MYEQLLSPITTWSIILWNMENEVQYSWRYPGCKRPYTKELYHSFKPHCPALANAPWSSIQGTERLNNTVGATVFNKSLIWKPWQFWEAVSIFHLVRSPEYPKIFKYFILELAAYHLNSRMYLKNSERETQGLLSARWRTEIWYQKVWEKKKYSDWREKLVL